MCFSCLEETITFQKSSFTCGLPSLTTMVFYTPPEKVEDLSFIGHHTLSTTIWSFTESFTSYSRVYFLVLFINRRRPIWFGPKKTEPTSLIMTSPTKNLKSKTSQFFKSKLENFPHL